MGITGFSEILVHGVTYQKIIFKVAAVQRIRDPKTSVPFELQIDASSLFYTILSVKVIHCSCKNTVV
jgi:hypothetical protein